MNKINETLKIVPVCLCILLAGWWISAAIQKKDTDTAVAPQEKINFPGVIKLDISSIGGTPIYLSRNKMNMDVLSTSLPNEDMHPIMIFSGQAMPILVSGPFDVNVSTMPTVETKAAKTEP